MGILHKLKELNKRNQDNYNVDRELDRRARYNKMTDDEYYHRQQEQWDRERKEQADRWYREDEQRRRDEERRRNDMDRY